RGSPAKVSLPKVGVPKMVPTAPAKAKLGVFVTLAKNIAIRERMRLQFRSEFFNVSTRNSEIGRVRDVEELAAELQAHSLANRDILRQRQIHVPETRGAHGATAGVAVEVPRLDLRVRRYREGRPVDPIVRAARSLGRITDGVRPAVGIGFAQR